jgi:predicted dehydrogenase
VPGQATALRSAVVGLGRIGQGYDYDRADAGAVLTHASAFAHHERFELVAGVDPDPEQRERFTRKFDRPAFAAQDELPDVDVVALAMPAAGHRAALEAALDRGVRAIVCEKPLAATVRDGEAMVAACEQAGCALLVNYMRRFEPAVRELRGRLAAGEIGEVRAGAGWYPGGLLENGSHMVDLVEFLLGPVERAAATSPDAVSPAARIDTAAATIDLLPAPAGAVNVFQLELIGTAGSLRYLQSGMSYAIHRPATLPELPHVQVLDASAQPQATDLPRYGLHVLDGLAGHLDGGAPLASDGRSALRTLRVCDQLLHEPSRVLL